MRQHTTTTESKVTNAQMKALINVADLAVRNMPSCTSAKGCTLNGTTVRSSTAECLQRQGLVVLSNREGTDLRDVVLTFNGWDAVCTERGW
ncbi:MAG: hypothetical protein V3S82_10230 [Dehalococcoidia bacterium]